MGGGEAGAGYRAGAAGGGVWGEGGGGGGEGCNALWDRFAMHCGIRERAVNIGTFDFKQK